MKLPRISFKLPEIDFKPRLIKINQDYLDFKEKLSKEIKILKFKVKKSLVQLNQFYLVAKPLIIKKSQKYIKFLRDVSNKLGRARLMHICRWINPRLQFLLFSGFKILLEGILIFVAIQGIISPIHIAHNIFSYGLALFIVSRLSSKVWTRIVHGKMMIRGETVNIKEVEIQMKAPVIPAGEEE